MSYRLFAVCLLLALVTACGGAKEREAKYLQRGKALFEQGDFVKAQLEFRNVLQINPDAADAQYYLGLIAEQEGDWQQAFARFRRVTEQKPDFVPAHIRLGHLYLLAGEVDRAEEAAATAARLEPDATDLYPLRAAIFLRRGQLGPAREQAEAALARVPDHVAAAIALASVQEREGDADAAIATLDRSVALNRGNISLRLFKIKINLDRGHFDDAVATYRELMTVQPTVFGHRAALAQLFINRGRLDDAEAVLREAIAAKVGGEQAKLALVDLLVHRDGVAVGERELKTLMADEPDVYAYAFKLAELYATNDRSVEAEAVLSGIVARDGTGPNGLNARAALAKLAAAKGDPERARKLLSEILKEDPANADALLLRGTLLLAAGDKDGAVADARAVLRNAPRSPKALRLLADAQLRGNDSTLAMDTLAQLIEVDPDNAFAHEALAALHVHRGNLDKGLDLLNAELSRTPQRPQALLSKAEILIAQRKWDEADATIQAILALPDRKFDGEVLAGRRFQAMGRTDDAVRAFEQARALKPAAPEPLTGIVQSYLAANKPDAALAVLRKAAAAAPQDAFVQNLLGEVLTRSNHADATEATAAFRRAIALKADWFVPYLNLGNMLLASGEAVEGLATFRDGLDHMPDNETLLFALASGEERSGDAGAAIETYEKILNLRPQAEVAANNLAALLADFRYTDKAALDRALALAKPFETSDNPFYLDTLGWVLYRRGDAQQARIYLERAVGIRSDVPVVHYHLGMTFAKMGDTKGAVAELAKATASDARYQGLDEAKSMLSVLREKTSQATLPER